MKFKSLHTQYSNINSIFFSKEKLKKINFKVYEKEAARRYSFEDRVAMYNFLSFSQEEILTNDEIKNIIKDKSSYEKIQILNNIISFFKSSKPELKKGVFNGRFIAADDTGKEYILESTDHKRFTLEELETFFNSKIPKAFLRGCLYEIDLKRSSRALIVEYTMKNRFDFFRILGKECNFEFTKEELLSIIRNPEFPRKTTSGTFGAYDTADIMNRRAVIMHQKNVDEEVFMAVVDTIKDDKTALDSFFKTASRGPTLERWRDIPAVQLLLKLQ